MSRVGLESGMMKDSLNTGAIHKSFRIYQRLIVVCCCVLIFSPVAGVPFAEVSGINHDETTAMTSEVDAEVQKCAYIGQATKVLLLGSSDTDYADPTLYREHGIFMASWIGTTVSKMDSLYSGKFDMDKERNIRILGVKREDAGRYYVIFGAGHRRHKVAITLTVKDKPQECLDFPTEGTGHDTTTSGSNKDYTASVTPEQMLQLLCNYSQKVMTEPYGSSSFLNTGLLFALLVIVSLDIGLRNKTCIRACWITMKRWIQEKFCSEHMMPEQSSESHESTSVIVPIDESELTEHQVRNWLEKHPEFFETNGEHENHLPVTPLTIDELGITIHMTEREDNQGSQWMSSQEHIVTYETCSSSSSDATESLRNKGYSGMQSVHEDEKKAAPEGDKAQTDTLDKSGKWMKKAPNSDDDNNEPLLGKAFNPE